MAACCTRVSSVSESAALDKSLALVISIIYKARQGVNNAEALIV